MTEPRLERIVDSHCVTGEGPLYHPDEERIYWVDIPRGHLHRYDPATGTHDRPFERDGPIGGFTIQADGSLLLFEEAGRIERWADGPTTTVVESIDGEEYSRFNDVIADPEGRVFAGTMPTSDRDGSLYRIGTDGAVERTGVAVEQPNGMGFTPDCEGFYYTDTITQVIRRYEYDRATGELSNPRTVVDGADEEGLADGMTVDAKGDLWSARWDGGRLVQYRPSGEEVRRIQLPARKVSSVTFGPGQFDDGASGDEAVVDSGEYGTAYVTTALGAAGDETDVGDRAVEGDGAGALFAVDLGVTGVQEFRSDVSA